MKEKFNFIYETVVKALQDLNGKRISVDQAKALAALAKQANNTFVTQLSAAKFLATVKDAETHLEETGLK